MAFSILDPLFPIFTKKNQNFYFLGTLLSPLTIGTSLSFDADDFDQKHFIRCAYVSEKIHRNEQRIIHCEKPVLGHYIAVYVSESQRVAMSICELEVYGTTICSEYTLQWTGGGGGEIKSRVQSRFKPINIC